MARILVAEDGAHFRRSVAERLRREGHEVGEANDGREALDLLARQAFDLLICDLMMPRLEGHALLRELRASGRNLPVIMVTAREGFEDKRRGFEGGADDYLVKPVDLNELALRVGALLKRAAIGRERRIVLGRVVVDLDTLSVAVDGLPEVLPKKEFLLLFKLLSHPRRIFTRRELMDDIWGLEAESDERTVDSHIKKLRKRFEALPEFEIVTIRGLGYKAERRLP